MSIMDFIIVTHLLNLNVYGSIFLNDIGTIFNYYYRK